MTQKTPGTEIEGYLASYAGYMRDIAGRAPKTIARHQHCIGLFIRRATEIHLAIEDVDISAFQACIEGMNLAPSTAVHTHTAVKSWCKYLHRMGVLPHNPLAQLPVPKMPDTRHRFYSPEEIDRLLAACEEDTLLGLRNRSIMEILYDTGIRSHELRHLRVTDIDLEQRILRVYGKGNKQRVIPLNHSAMLYLRKYLSRRKEFFRPGLNPTDILFPSAKTGNAISSTRLWAIVKQYVYLADLGDAFTPHTLRHAFASHMLANGADLRIVQLLLGHTSISTTEIYTQVSAKRLKDLHQKYHPRA